MVILTRGVFTVEYAEENANIIDTVQRSGVNLEPLEDDKSRTFLPATEGRPDRALANRENWRSKAKSRRRLLECSNYLYRAKNRYLTENDNRGRALRQSNKRGLYETEISRLKLMRCTSSRRQLYTTSVEILLSSVKRQLKSKNRIGKPSYLGGKKVNTNKRTFKLSTLDNENEAKMKTNSKENLDLLASFEGFIASSKAADIPHQPLSPISSPQPKAGSGYRIPKTQKPEIQIVPLPPIKFKGKTYATSLKARRPTLPIVRQRDPRTRRVFPDLSGIPPGARKEFTDNQKSIDDIDRAAIPEQEELLSKSESRIRSVNEEKATVSQQLNALRDLWGEEEYLAACYQHCNTRMQLDYKLHLLQTGLRKQKKNLDELRRTRAKLFSRNQKLAATAERNNSRLRTLIKSNNGKWQEQAADRVQPSSNSQHGGAKNQVVMKPKTAQNEDKAGEQASSGKTHKNKSLLFKELCSQPAHPTDNNTSDNFFDADATMLETSSDSGSNMDDKGSEATEEGKSQAGDTDGGEITSLMTRLGGPSPIPIDIKQDIDAVSAAVIKAGGLISNRPKENRERRGQKLELENVELDIGKANDEHANERSLHLFFLFDLFPGELGPLKERPAESSLQKVDFKDLLPPPSSRPVAIDFEFDPSLPEFVREQRIEFLLVQRPKNSADAWSFPTEEQMRFVWDYVRNKLDSDDILDVCLWNRFDRATGITSVMLSTVNLQLMAEVRHEIRVYSGVEGIRFETYNKALFVKKYGISMYVPKEHAGLSPQRILRAVFYKHRDIYTRNITLLSKHRFETNPPGFQLGQRSRIGDAIFLFDSPELATKLKKYDEDYRFTVSKGFNITLKGGARGEGHQTFSAEMTSKVIVQAVDQAMKGAVDSHAPV